MPLYVSLPGSGIAVQSLVSVNTIQGPTWTAGQYKSIHISLVGSATNAGAMNEFIAIRANADSGANYQMTGLFSNSVGVTTPTLAGQTSARVGSLNTSAQSFVNYQIDIYPNINGFNRSIRSYSSAIWTGAASPGWERGAYDGLWLDTTTPWTSFQLLFTASANTFFTGEMIVTGIS